MLYHVMLQGPVPRRRVGQPEGLDLFGEPSATLPGASARLPYKSLVARAGEPVHLLHAPRELPAGEGRVEGGLAALPRAGGRAVVGAVVGAVGRAEVVRLHALGMNAIRVTTT